MHSLFCGEGKTFFFLDLAYLLRMNLLVSLQSFLKDASVEGFNSCVWVNLSLFC